MEIPGNIRISDYHYFLPQERIAQFPLERRDASRLLVWNQGRISENSFSDLASELPARSLLVFNDTRVIHARLIFSKPTGATIEIFCLDPLSPTTEIEAAFSQTGCCTWKCLIGNVKRWKSGTLEKQFDFEGVPCMLSARNTGDLGDGCFAVEFHWEPGNHPFSAILEKAGLVPLPPYITRASVPLDDLRYQTIYAKHEGSVAAPTAGLHFMPGIFEKLKEKEILTEKVTLHVGIGTFRPVSADTIASHLMHEEKITVTLPVIRRLAENDPDRVIAVGTTSVRTLESLYWAGVKLLANPTSSFHQIRQWDAYDPELDRGVGKMEALSALAGWLERNGLDRYHGSTSMMIVPGYRFRVVKGMITNFHMPQSTLLLLVAAFTGPGWKMAYDYALQHGFRFLSYGDACLFF